MVTEKNNMHDVDPSMFFQWVFKAFVAVYLVTVSYTHLDVYKRQALVSANADLQDSTAKLKALDAAIHYICFIRKVNFKNQPL